MFIRASEALKRKQLFLICRYTVILATGSLVIAEIAKEASFLPGALLVAIAIASNLVLGRVEPFGFFDPWLQAPVIVSDTALISMSLLLSRASQELFLFFFFILIMAAKLESLVTLGICAATIGFASFLMGTDQAGFASPTLMRVPFTFATALFFGYVVLPERNGQMYTFRAPIALTGQRPARKNAPSIALRVSKHPRPTASPLNAVEQTAPAGRPD
ncbi:MAG: hypothetical protein ACHQ9S_26930 [Candidatus Binatia bacterium]